jgi:hypothetical protein
LRAEKQRIKLVLRERERAKKLQEKQRKTDMKREKKNAK